MAQDLLRPYLDRSLAQGWNPFLEDDAETGMEFGIFCLPAKQNHTFQSDSHEAAMLILAGKGAIRLGDRQTSFDRSSWLNELPWTVHVPMGVDVEIRAESDTEIAVVRTLNPDEFDPRVYLPAQVETEHRGKGILGDTSYRIVRTIFDRRNTPAESRLVLGEVINFPGRWSSYPPHHHTQPELYYYRFDPEWGYGHAELGEEVFKVRRHDLLKITGGRDHPQSAPPGVTMYYLWAIRHLPGDPYMGFEYTEPFDSLLAAASR